MDGSTDREGFRFLQPLWPELHDAATRAVAVGVIEPEMAAIRLRGFSETMVGHLYRRIGLDDGAASQFERLVRLEREDLLDARLLAKLHVIRKIGNNAAHNGRVSSEQVASLLDDAWSLAVWFCRFMRPDLQWITPVHRPGSFDAPDPVRGSDQGVARQPTNSSDARRASAFPVERAGKVRTAVERAMADVQPAVRVLRTRMAMHEAFTEPLNDDQGRCVSKMERFLGDPDGRVFLLRGYAGTGKTFLMKGVTEYLASQGRPFTLLAPTGRAAKVMSERTEREARTIHGAIYDYDDLREVKGEDDTSEGFKIVATVRSAENQATTVFIIDEASLVSDVYSESEFYRSGSGYLLRDLIDYAALGPGDHDRKIMLVGDQAQLPPVGMAMSPALDATYLEDRFGIRADGYQLTEVVRQKLDSEVLRNVMPLRKSLESDIFGGLSFEFGKDVRRIEEFDLVPTYLAAREHGRPIIITHSNSDASSLNRAVRERLFADATVTGGDTLIVTTNTMVGGIFVVNGEFVQVTSVDPRVEQRTIMLRQRDPDSGTIVEIEVILTFRDIEVELACGDGPPSILRLKILDDHLHAPAAGLTPAQQRALYVDFVRRHPDLRNGPDRSLFGKVLRSDPYFNAVRVKFGYAVTCHKAQGGEWQDVFVSCPSAQNPRTAGYFRWLYTAMTRSSARLYMLNPPEIRLKVSGPDWWSPPVADLPVEPAVTPDDGNGMPTIKPQVQSPEGEFQAALEARVAALLTPAGITVDEVAHNQYQEAFFLSRGVDTARANISYNGRFKVGSVVVLRGGDFVEDVRRLLASLVGGNMLSPSSTAPAQSRTPSLPFLKDAHERLVAAMSPRNIRVDGLEERAWCQRYTFVRGDERAVVDMFYDGKNRVTRCMPLRTSNAPSSTPPLVADVMHVMTTEFVP